MRTPPLGLALVLIVSVYVNYRTPAPDIDPLNCEAIEPVSYVNLAPEQPTGMYAVLPLASRRGLLGLSARERGRCWALFRILVDVFRYAPDRVDSLERVVRAYRPDGSIPVEARYLHRVKGDRSL